MTKIKQSILLSAAKKKSPVAVPGHRDLIKTHTNSAIIISPAAFVN
jgi:hypothetical protein